MISMVTAAHPAQTAPVVIAATFRAIGATNRVLATDVRTLAEAVALAREHLAEVDAAVSRFRPDSEVSLLAARARTHGASVLGSPVLVDYLGAALHAARITDGLVDPTVGAAVVASGYDLDMDEVRARGEFVPTGTAPVPGWRSIHVDEPTGRIGVPQGCLIDLGATAKAHAADVIARLLGARLPGGFLVNLGGDIAVGGDLPRAGWQVGVETAEGVTVQVVTSTGQAFATSSTRLRTWTTSSGLRHHIVDPRAGTTASATWTQVTCAGATALEANAASTAAVVLGTSAPAWLSAHGIPARLDGPDGRIVRTRGWPDPGEGVRP